MHKELHITVPVGETQDEHPHLNTSKPERLSWAQGGGTLSFPGHATLGWELHGFASAVMLASNLFNSDTALKFCVYCFWSEASYVPWPHPPSPWPSQASIASNLFFEAWFPLKWMAMLSSFLETTFNCSSNSLSSPWNTFL